MFHPEGSLKFSLPFGEEEVESVILQNPSPLRLTFKTKGQFSKNICIPIFINFHYAFQIESVGQEHINVAQAVGDALSSASLYVVKGGSIVHSRLKGLYVSTGTPRRMPRIRGRNMKGYSKRVMKDAPQRSSSL